MRALLPRSMERLFVGKSYREILSLASERKSDIIAMGVRGRNPLDIMLFGSTTTPARRAPRRMTRAHPPEGN